MIQLFNSYQTDLLVLFDHITDNAKEFPDLLVPKKEQAIAQLQSDVKQALSLLNNMQIEVNGIAQKNRSQYQVKMRDYKLKLDINRRRIREMQNQYIQQKFNTTMREGQADAQSKAIELHRQGLDQLKEGVRIGYQIDQIGVQGLRNLQGHTSLLDRNIKRTVDIRGLLNDSGRMITRMRNRITKNKYVMSGVIVTLLATIFIIIYLNVGKKHS